jgi:hypothetical protein
MKLSEYFENKKGLGVIATADSDGRVDAAVYARPHFIDEETIAFIMLERLTHKNLQSNPHAAYLFMEEGDKYIGKRLYLTKIREEKNSEFIDTLRRRKDYKEYKDTTRYLVYFRIDKVLPLVGDKK